MSKRISPYLRDITHKLLMDYCAMNEYDISRAVDELLYGRLAYLEEARQKALKKAEQERQINNPTIEEIKERVRAEQVIESLKEVWKK